MNKVYAVHEGNYEKWCYIAAENFKKAKKIALFNPLCNFCDNPFIDISGHLCRDKNKKPITTDFSGELEIQQIVDVGLAWWTCEGNEGNCESKQFEMSDGGWKWKCRVCGREGHTLYD